MFLNKDILLTNIKKIHLITGMEWKSTLIVNITMLALPLTRIKEEIQIGAIIVGMVWTGLQITVAVINLQDRYRKVQKVKKRRKKNAKNK